MQHILSYIRHFLLYYIIEIRIFKFYLNKSCTGSDAKHLLDNTSSLIYTSPYRKAFQQPSYYSKTKIKRTGDFQNEENQNHWNPQPAGERNHRWMRRVPNLLPICLQDLLRRSKPALWEPQAVSNRKRTEKVGLLSLAAPFFYARPSFCGNRAFID